MRRSNQIGFTIIETMLFLSVTGLMVMAILIGSNSSINFQRYKDSVNSLQALLQQQYSDVSNTINNHDGTWECTGATSPVQPPGLTNSVRGQSNCVILGRIITSSDGENITINDVVGYMPTTSTSALNEIEIFRKLNPGKSDGYGAYVSKTNTQDFSSDWNTFILNSNGNKTFSIMILRSPNTGEIHTFFKNEYVDVDDLASVMVNNITETEPNRLCVDPNGLLIIGSNISAVTIMPDASGPNDIETSSEDIVCNV